MRKPKTLAIVVALGLGLIFLNPFAAQAKTKKGHESQKGGLPALEDRVDALTLLVDEQETDIVDLETHVAALQTQVNKLLGQNQFAVVSAAGAIVRSSAGVTIETHTVSSGAYELTFNKDVSGCAYVATLGDTAHAAPPVGEVSVSGDTDSDNVNDVFVQTTNSAGAAADASFHLYVSCP
jgi:hypothetical protein